MPLSVAQPKIALGTLGWDGIEELHISASGLDQGLWPMPMREEEAGHMAPQRQDLFAPKCW
jgi:hypothetical protein